MGSPEAAGQRAERGPPAFLGRLGPVLLRHRYLIGAIVVALCTSAVVVSTLRRYPLPSGGDPGQWLQLSNAILGVGRTPLSPLQYPPAMPLLQAGFKAVLGDPLLAIYATLATITAIVPLCAYASYTIMTDDRRGALFFTIFIGFNQGFFDMLSWGGYPNYLSFGPMMLAFAFLVKTSRPGSTKRDAFIFGALTGLVFLTHPLSSLILAMGCAAFAGLRLLFAWDWAWIKRLALFAIPPFAALYLPFVYLRAANHVESASYLTTAPVFSIGAAWQPLVPWRLRQVFPLVDWFTIPLTILCITLALLPLRHFRTPGKAPPIFARLGMPGDADRHRSHYFVFVAMFVPPFAMPLAIAGAGYGADFPRAMYYPYIPIAAILAALAAAFAHRGADREIGRRLVHALRVMLRGVEAHLHPVRHPRLRAAFHDWAGTAMLLLVVGALVNMNVLYLGVSVDFYARGDLEADFELARWLHEHLGVDDRILLSSDTADQVYYNQLAGMTEREVLQYTQPWWLFYGAERTRNHELYQMFANRYALGGRSLEASTQGTAPYADFQMRITVLARLAEFPAIEFEDERTSVERLNGSLALVGNFRQRSASLEPLSDHELALWSRASDHATGLSFTRMAALDGDDIVVTLTATERGVPLRSVHMWAVRAGRMCDVAMAGETIEWRVQDGAGCHSLTATFTPGATADIQRDFVDLNISLAADGTAQLRFRGETVDSGYEVAVRAFDSSLLFEKYQVTEVVMLRDNLRSIAYLQGEYGFPVSYENSRYLVLEARPPT